MRWFSPTYTRRANRRSRPRTARPWRAPCVPPASSTRFSSKRSAAWPKAFAAWRAPETWCSSWVPVPSARYRGNLRERRYMSVETISFQGLRGELRRDEPMSRHVSWKAGGPADRFFAPVDLEDLSAFLGQLPEEEPILFVGLGSNLLVREGGWRGTVILTYAASKRPRMEDGLLYAEAGVACPRVARFAADNNLGSAEWLTGIPGTVGGALAG